MNTSAEHPICKDCIHRFPGPHDGIPYHPEQWCFMFMHGEHVDEQGYCGQFRAEKKSANLATEVD